MPNNAKREWVYKNFLRRPTRFEQIIDTVFIAAVAAILIGAWLGYRGVEGFIWLTEPMIKGG